ncbi:protein Flattop [Engraulis encrasicolus]|uniref:protein Flattop n=1 Tax=Engraulis encrasicolus TaxID=184585 RepID=UPI002FD44AA4
MSSSFSANQYEGSFKSQKLQNWTVPKHFKERPCAVTGHTTIIATDRGHLLPGLKAKGSNAWASFVGTWDMPNRIPPTYINCTARSLEGQERLKNYGNPRDTTKKAKSPRQSGGTPKAKGEATTDQSVSQEPQLEAPVEQPAAPQTPAAAAVSFRTPEPQCPASECNPSPSQRCDCHERPASQKSHADDDERPATQQQEGEAV